MHDYKLYPDENEDKTVESLVGVASIETQTLVNLFACPLSRARVGTEYIWVEFLLFLSYINKVQLYC